MKFKELYHTQISYTRTRIQTPTHTYTSKRKRTYIIHILINNSKHTQQLTYTIERDTYYT